MFLWAVCGSPPTNTKVSECGCLGVSVKCVVTYTPDEILDVKEEKRQSIPLLPQFFVSYDVMDIFSKNLEINIEVD